VLPNTTALSKKLKTTDSTDIHGWSLDERNGCCWQFNASAANLPKVSKISGIRAIRGYWLSDV